MIVRSMGGLLLAGALALAAMPARAGEEEVAALLERAGKAVAAGDWREAFAALEPAYLETFARMPLAIRKATFVAEEPASFGSYEPRPDHTFRPGEPLLVYLEPVGYAFRDAGDGTVVYGFAADVAILSADGEVLGGQRDFGRWEFRARTPNTASFVFLRLELEGLPVGDYRLAVRVRDAGSDEADEVLLPFTVAGG